MQRRIVFLPGPALQQHLVYSLHQVVSPLVQPVDRPLHRRDVRIARQWIARLIFLMPKLKVRAVLF